MVLSDDKIFISLDLSPIRFNSMKSVLLFSDKNTEKSM